MENPFLEKTSRVPQFLKILCTLSLINTGWYLLSNLIGVITYDSRAVAEAFRMTEEIMEETFSAFGGMPSAILNYIDKMMEVTLKYGFWMNLIIYLAYILNLLAIWRMYRLKRYGFFMYIAAQIVIVMTPVFFTSFDSSVMLVQSPAALFALLFIFLYNLNLKYLE